MFLLEVFVFPKFVGDVEQKIRNDNFKGLSHVINVAFSLTRVNGSRRLAKIQQENYFVIVIVEHCVRFTCVHDFVMRVAGSVLAFQLHTNWLQVEVASARNVGKGYFLVKLIQVPK